MAKIKNVIIGGGVGVALTLIAYFIALGTGEELAVETPAISGPIPFAAFIFIPVMSVVGASVVALISLRTKNPRRFALGVGFLVLGLMAFSPFIANSNDATIIWLQVLHLVLALPILIAYNRLPAIKS
jgi:peptidoglycan/LPS O-acetylase OafA/YrhL